jgi:tetratricopeptide (TPR) repeat protein
MMFHVMSDVPAAFRTFCRTALLLGILAAPALSQTPDAATKFRLAQSLEQAGEIERAAHLYRELLARDSTNFLFFDGAQRTLLALKRYDEALDLINRRLTRNPGDLNLHALLGSVLYRAGREKDADKAWDNAIALAPTNPNTYRLIAGVMVENRLLDKAAATYRRGRDACNDPMLYTMELAQLLVASMDYKGATLEYLRWLEQNPAQVGFVQNRMAQFSWKPDGRQAAVEAVRAAIDRREDVRLYELLAWLYMEGKDFGSAYEVYRKIDKLSGATGLSIYGFAQRAFHEGAFALSARAYRAALDASLPAGRQAAALYGYASSLKELAAAPDTSGADRFAPRLPAPEARSRYANVIGSFKDVIQRFPHTEYAARSYMQIGIIQFEEDFDLDAALASLDRVKDENPGIAAITYDVALKEGQILTARGDTVAAMTRFLFVAAAPGATPDQSDEATYRLAELEYFRDQFTAAIHRLDSLSLDLKADYANDALALRAFLQENASSSPQALTEFARADFLARQRKNMEAIALYQDIVRKYPQAFLVDDALMHAASLQARAGLYQEAIASYETLLRQFKESSVSLDRAQFQMGEIYEAGLKDPANAIACYEKLLVDYPRSVLVEQARDRIRHLRGDVQ